jgi:hypothetical protein
MRYRVDNIPWPLRPFYFAISWLLGLTLYFYYFLCRVTSRVIVEGLGDHDLSQHAIFCLWHEDWWPFFIVFWRFPSKHVMIAHPAAYMKPIHVLLRLIGIKKLLLGSSGDEGKRAAQEMTKYIRDGYSTYISPDGPAGPPKVLKKGVLHVAMQSGVPIVPLRIRSLFYIPIPSWDSKKIPLPFNRFIVNVGAAILVSADSFEGARSKLEAALHG